ncbi:MAG: molybdopterin-dependent oxidoreductase, partial [Candidatus Desulfofervidaceae bacterium]|nr:molybdopterin-dependent oxidoreductase [Candidatus Desulfofervidaceae bacterium]
RVGERGEGKWQEIEWSEAINLLTNKLNSLKSSGATESLLCIDGSASGVMSGLLKRFCRAYGTSNYFHLNQDRGAALAIKVMQGSNVHIGFDLENADYILSFGSQLLEGWGAPAKMQAIYGHWRENSLKPKAKLVQIEPRMSDTAAKADEWLPLVPGTEAVLALGLAHVIVREGLYDTSFVSSSTADFSAFKEFVSTYVPEKVAEITGLAKEDIIRIAREFASARRPLAIWSRGKGYNSSGVSEVVAIHALNALVGNLNKSGGVVFFKDVINYLYPEAEDNFKDISSFISDVADKKAYVEMAIICEANPAYKLPQIFDEGVKNIPFVVNFSTFLNDTALQSDLVLPMPFYLERWDGVTTPRGLHYPVFGVSKPVIKPLYETQHPGDVILKTAEALGLKNQLPWSNYKEFLRDIAQRIYKKGQGKLANGASTEQLPSSFEAMWNKLNTCVWFNPDVTKEGMKQKFKFMPTILAKSGWEVKGNEKEYPLTLIPCERFILAENLGSAPYLIKQLPDTVLKGNEVCVEVHPETAAKYGLKNGEIAYLQTPFGKAKVRIYCYECIRPGVIAVPVGLGHKGYDEYLAGKGVNAYALLGYTKEATGVASCVMSRANLVKI